MLANKLKGFFKDSVIYGMGDALGRLISLIMLPILTRAFVPADYGAIDLLGVSYMFVLIGISLNVPSGIIKQYYQLSKDDQKILITSSCVYLLGIAVAVSALIIFTADFISQLVSKDSGLVSSVQVLALCLPIELLFTLLQFVLRLKRKAVLFTASNVMRVMITPLLVLLMVVGLDMGVIGVFISKIISLAIITTGVFFLVRKEFGTTISYKVFSSTVLFTLPGYPAIMIKQLMDMLPRSILASVAPLSAVGLFGIASRVSKLMNLYIMAFNRSWGPFAYAQADKPEEKKIYVIVFKTFSFSLIIMSLGLSLLGEEVITLLTPSQYHSAHYLVTGLVFYQGVRGMTHIFGTALYVADQVKWTSYLNIIQLVVFLIGAFILVPRFHSFGLIAAMDIAIVTYFLCYMRVTLQHFSFYIPKVRLGILLVSAVASVFLLKMIAAPIIVKLTIKICFIACFTGVGAILIFSSDEWFKAKEYLTTLSKPIKKL